MHKKNMLLVLAVVVSMRSGQVCATDIDTVTKEQHCWQTENEVADAKKVAECAVKEQDNPFRVQGLQLIDADVAPFLIPNEVKVAINNMAEEERREQKLLLPAQQQEEEIRKIETNAYRALARRNFEEECKSIEEALMWQLQIIEFDDELNEELKKQARHALYKASIERIECSYSEQKKKIVKNIVVLDNEDESDFINCFLRSVHNPQYVRNVKLSRIKNVFVRARNNNRAKKLEEQKKLQTQQEEPKAAKKRKESVVTGVARGAFTEDVEDMKVQHCVKAVEKAEVLESAESRYELMQAAEVERHRQEMAEDQQRYDRDVARDADRICRKYTSRAIEMITSFLERERDQDFAKAFKLEQDLVNNYQRYLKDQRKQKYDASQGLTLSGRDLNAKIKICEIAAEQRALLEANGGGLIVENNLVTIVDPDIRLIKDIIESLPTMAPDDGVALREAQEELLITEAPIAEVRKAAKRLILEEAKRQDDDVDEDYSSLLRNARRRAGKLAD